MRSTRKRDSAQAGSEPTKPQQTEGAAPGTKSAQESRGANAPQSGEDAAKKQEGSGHSQADPQKNSPRKPAQESNPQTKKRGKMPQGGSTIPVRGSKFSQARQPRLGQLTAGHTDGYDPSATAVLSAIANMSEGGNHRPANPRPRPKLRKSGSKKRLQVTVSQTGPSATENSEINSGPGFDAADKPHPDSGSKAAGETHSNATLEPHGQLDAASSDGKSLQSGSGPGSESPSHQGHAASSHAPGKEVRKRSRTAARLRRSLGFKVDVFVILALAGVLLGISAVNASGSRVASDLPQLLRNETRSIQKLEQANEKLRQKIQQKTMTAEAPGLMDSQSIAIATAKVQGPGVVVSLTDAPPPPIGADVNLNDYVVHQQDVEGVMNALWVGGAEAMTVQGHRVVGTSKIRCVGNVIYVDGQVYSPPFVISAIGDPQALMNALENDQAIQTYKQFVKSKGLGFDVRQVKNLVFPPAKLEPSGA